MKPVSTCVSGPTTCPLPTAVSSHHPKGTGTGDSRWARQSSPRHRAKHCLQNYSPASPHSPVVPRVPPAVWVGSPTTKESGPAWCSVLVRSRVKTSGLHSNVGSPTLAPPFSLSHSSADSHITETNQASHTQNSSCVFSR